VRAGIVEKAEDYVYSCAGSFAGRPCLLKIVQGYMPTEKLPVMRTVK
jgi:hypothetical protein